MIEWVYRAVHRSHYISDVWIATDDSRIEAEVKSFRGQVVMTSSHHQSGTDRVIEALTKITSSDIILNVQGDEPGIESELINGVIETKLAHRNWPMSTAATPITDRQELQNPNRVKVVLAHNGKALYFSRSAIPNQNHQETESYRHLGIYCFEKEKLLAFPELPTSSLEKAESLEQLRALQAGWDIGVHISPSAQLSIDSPDDLQQFIKNFH